MKIQMPRIKKKVVACFPCIYLLFTCCFQSAYSMEVSLKQAQSQRAFLEAVASNDAELIKKALDENPDLDPDTKIIEGVFSGVSALWFAAVSLNWNIVRRMLQNNPRANLDNALQEGPDRGKTIKELISENAPESLLKMMLLQYFYYQDGVGGFINPLTNSYRFQVQFEELNKIFKRFRFSFFDLDSTRDYYNLCAPTHIINPDKFHFDYIPRDVRWLISIHLLREEDAEFKNHSDHVLKTIIMKFQGQYKDRDKDEIIADMIACGTLQQLYPTQENRKNPQGEIMYDKKARSYSRFRLKQIIFYGMMNGILPKQMNEMMRRKVVNALSNRPIQGVFPTHDIEKRLKNIDWNEVDVAQDVEEKESPRNLKKREREEIPETE